MKDLDGTTSKERRPIGTVCQARRHLHVVVGHTGAELSRRCSHSPACGSGHIAGWRSRLTNRHRPLAARPLELSVRAFGLRGVIGGFVSDRQRGRCLFAGSSSRASLLAVIVPSCELSVRMSTHAPARDSSVEGRARALTSQSQASSSPAFLRSSPSQRVTSFPPCALPGRHNVYTCTSG